MPSNRATYIVELFPCIYYEPENFMLVNVNKLMLRY